jgi:TolA-binding protein
VLVARGKFEQVVAEATARPLSSCLAQCNSQDLRALADAARYSNRLPLATQALLRLRKRFSGSAEHAVAAFLLGRTYEAARASNEARVWYARYLAEAPSGEFAVDAAAGAARLTETR